MAETAQITQHGNAKFPLVEAYVLHKQGKTYEQLAKKYGVDKSAFSHRFKKHFPATDPKEFLKIRHDLYRLIEASNIEELLKRGTKKVSDRQLIGNLMGINQILTQEIDKTGDINIQIVNILNKSLGSNDTSQVSQDKESTIHLDYNEQEQAFTPTTDN